MSNILDQVLNLEEPPPAEPVPLPESPRHKLGDPAFYIPYGGLLDAVRVALELRQPLLLTGEPGTGKTRLADFVAMRLGLPKPLFFQVKSTSNARDLFYTYDALGRFNSRQDADSDDVLRFIQFNALGLAFLFANPGHAVQRYLRYVTGGPQHENPRLSVVLIDEIDKAPRDFPNDILGEIDNMSFTVTELNHATISADPSMTPVVIITSNSEKDLPEAFLRRCIYYHITFPPRPQLEDIILKRLSSILPEQNTFLDGALTFFLNLRQQGELLQKRPSISELLEWLLAMQAGGANFQNEFSPHAPVVDMTLGTLFKTQEDLQEGRRLLRVLREGAVEP